MDKFKMEEVAAGRPTPKPTAQACSLRKKYKSLENGATHHGCLPRNARAQGHSPDPAGAPGPAGPALSGHSRVRASRSLFSARQGAVGL